MFYVESATTQQGGHRYPKPERVGQCHRSLASKMEILCCSSKAGNLHSCGAAWWFHRIQERGIESTEALLIFPSWLLDLPT